MIASDSIQDQFSEIIDDLLPSSENAILVVRSSGTSNAYGEKTGEVETLTSIFLFYSGEDRSSRTTGAGNTSPITIRFFAKSSVTITEGNRIRFDSKDYLVTFIEKRSVGDHQIYWEGRMQKIHGN